MVLAEIAGLASSAVGGAYAYNMNRFTFDAAQHQNTVHQFQNLRITQWQVFREDVRDLFQLTTQNMSTYMVVGVLFLSVGANYMVNSIKADFPVEPSWAIVMFGLCMLMSMSFGILAVWLAMHGAIAAHSASVKVLTQAVRVPIPTTEELEKARGRLAAYESDPSKFLQLPNFLGVSGESQVTTIGEHSSSDVAASEEVAQAQDMAAELLRDEDWGGPGRGAAFDSHIKLFRQVYLNYACYDAYARIALSAAVHEQLIGCAHLIVAHQMLKYDERAERHARRVLYTWTSLIMITVTTLVLFKLDLFVEKMKIRMMKYTLLAGPFTVGVAATLWAFRRDELIDISFTQINMILLIGCLLHLSWAIFLLYETRPMDGEFRVPLSWRSVRYLDIFGWMKRDDDSAESRDAEQSELAAEWFHSARRQFRGLRSQTEYLADNDVLQRLAPGELEIFKRIQDDLNQLSDKFDGEEPSPSSQSWMKGALKPWIECEHFGTEGMNNPFYFNTITGEVTWNPPDSAEVMSLSAMAKSVVALQQSVEDQKRGFLTEDMSLGDNNNDDLRTPMIFTPMTKRPGSSYDIASMPWTYFVYICALNISLWSMTTGWLLWTTFFSRFETSDSPKRNDPISESLSANASAIGVTWPNRFFRPSAIACAGEELLIGDSFQLYTADSKFWQAREEVPSHKEQSLQLQQLRISVPAEPWKAAAVVRSDNASYSLLLLGRSGREIVEVAWEVAVGLPVVPRRWAVSRRLSASLRSFSAASGTAVAAVCNDQTSVSSSRLDAATGGKVASLDGREIGWGIYGATEHGEVVLLCPDSDQGSLEPVYVVASFPRLSFNDTTVKGDQSEIIGVHLDGAGTLWLVTHRTAVGAISRTDVNAFATDGTSRGSWKLPPGRVWTPGLCAPLHGHGFLLAAQRRGSPTARPELWHVHVDAPPVCDLAHDRG
eukprot:TRINITY_DN69775_c0_g1_i1.p1 TRINITY_DN69775_c0_g1~~TRINITY_DN69775_c0_g1_i1.p1  ORF type:complete len:977 (-),score=121.22 TRINITY_DN69775_c0_g1_i1:134-2959(-)